MRKEIGRHHLTTLFDEDVPALTPPGVITTGHNPAVLVHDVITLGNKNVGRFQGAIGMVGVKVRLPGDTACVEVELKADPSSRELLPEGSADAERSLPRLLLIRAQGRLRNAVILGPRARSSAHVNFQLTADEVADGGLLLLEALSVQLGDIPLPRPVRDFVASSGPAGIKIKRVHVRDVPEPVPATFIARARAERMGLVSAGGHTSRMGVGSPLSRGLFVMNPHPTLGASSVRLRFQPALPRRLPAIARRASRELAAGLVQPPALETIDLATGSRETSPLVRARGGSFEALVSGPVSSPRLGMIGAGGQGRSSSFLLRGVEATGR